MADLLEQDDNKLVEVDITNPNQEEGEEQYLNMEEDAWATPAPPPDGDYRVKVFPAKKFCEKGKTEKGELFFRVYLELKIQGNEEWAHSVIFAKVSTYIKAGKDISVAAGLCKKLGLTVPERMKPLALVQMLWQRLKAEPEVWVSGRWKAWDQPRKEWLRQGMNTFPQLEPGKYSHVVRDSKGTDVSGKFGIDKWFSLAEYSQVRKSPTLNSAKLPQAQAKTVTQSGPPADSVPMD